MRLIEKKVESKAVGEGEGSRERLLLPEREAGCDVMNASKGKEPMTIAAESRNTPQREGKKPCPEP